MKLVIGTSEYEFPGAPTYRERRLAARALGVTVDDLIAILTTNDRRSEREEVYAALALVTAGEDASRVLDLHPGDIDIRFEPGDIEEDDPLPPASSPDAASEADGAASETES